MNILGLSFDCHDAAAALLVDGKVVSAIQEERLSRVKHDRRFPQLSIEHCLKTAGLSLSDIDAVACCENSGKKIERLATGGLGKDNLALEAWLQKELGRQKGVFFICDHHQSHAAAAFFCSPFDTAAIITLDGGGDGEASSISIGQGTSIRKISSVRFPHSLSLFYSAFTAFLGFEVNEGEYKVMGMAGFGSPRYADKIRALIRLTETGFEIDQSYFNFRMPEGSLLTESFFTTFGPARKPDDAFTLAPGATSEERLKENRHYSDMAASLQAVTEEVILHYGRLAAAQTGLSKIAMAGDVALNSRANARLAQALGVSLYIQPAAGDSGSALGAALACHCAHGRTRPPELSSALLGGAYGEKAIRLALKNKSISDYTRIEDEEALLTLVANELAEGKIIGWFQGRSEWGPRALGARSILSRPFPKETQTRLNEKIKFREPFRPFAPAVLAEKATDYFDIPKPSERTQPESFMLSIAKVRPDKKAEIPAVTHVDGTARIQLVWPEEKTRYRRLIELLDEKTGVPVILNTSFNRRGEPIVETPDDALTTFLWSDLDLLVLESFIVRKSSVL